MVNYWFERSNRWKEDTTAPPTNKNTQLDSPYLPQMSMIIPSYLHVSYLHIKSYYSLHNTIYYSICNSSQYVLLYVFLCVFTGINHTMKSFKFLEKASQSWTTPGSSCTTWWARHKRHWRLTALITFHKILDTGA